MAEKNKVPVFVQKSVLSSFGAKNSELKGGSP